MAHTTCHRLPAPELLWRLNISSPRRLSGTGPILAHIALTQHHTNKEQRYMTLEHSHSADDIAERLAKGASPNYLRDW
ncbi:MAG: hypothetical protein ACR2OJ_09600, partial [Hyphomicrobiales bacterium]